MSISKQMLKKYGRGNHLPTLANKSNFLNPVHAMCSNNISCLLVTT